MDEQRENRSEGTHINIGSVSIIVIFAVLCLTVFSVLSLSTAVTERRLAERSAEAVTAYYAADLACAERADAIGEALKSGVSATEIAARAEEFGAELVAVTHEGTLLHLEQPVDGNQTLSAELLLSGGELHIRSWNVIDTGSWEPDDTIRVWSGDGSFAGSNEQKAGE